ncbi:hypothetical protein IVB16_31815 [Bradyrhizobium sp. 183]|nr:hypothetical protein IVB17_31815 [Bradyrhizobium sp. 184]UPJ87099.1 hypothetical protein IVB16_31815 [Bradyrhizobium sp. 183]
MRYSGLNLIAQALKWHTGWRPASRDAWPNCAYDVLIIGGGGMVLPLPIILLAATALSGGDKKGYIGSGNFGRNTTIIRSNYLLPGNTP